MIILKDLRTNQRRATRIPTGKEDFYKFTNYVKIGFDFAGRCGTITEI